jgi:hypothetical protein
MNWVQVELVTNVPFYSDTSHKPSCITIMYENTKEQCLNIWLYTYVLVNSSKGFSLSQSHVKYEKKLT